jgi:hypothetical protein
MTVYKPQETRSYQRHFRTYAWSAIAVLLGILLFSIYEPQGVSRPTNIALAFLSGAIVLGAILCAYILSAKQALWDVKHVFQWELTADKIIQKHDDGRTVEISLNDVRTLNEGRGWLFVGGGEPQKTIAIPSDVNGFDQIRRQLMAYCTVTPVNVKRSPIGFLGWGAWISVFVLFVISDSRAVILASGIALLLLYPLLTAHSLRPIWRTKAIPKRILLTYSWVWLILAWWLLHRLKLIF